MAKEKVIFLHGFSSSANLTKAQYLKERFKSLPQVEFHVVDFNPTKKDFEHMTVTGMINRLRQYILDKNLGSVRIIGSSLGSLVGIHYAYRFGTVKRLLLLAPVLSYSSLGISEEILVKWKKEGSTEVMHYAFNEKIPLQYNFHLDGLRYNNPVLPLSKVLIIHGKNDEAVPIEKSREYASKYPDRVILIEVDSDHLLNDRLDVIWEHIKKFLIT